MCLKMWGVSLLCMRCEGGEHILAGMRLSSHSIITITMLISMKINWHDDNKSKLAENTRKHAFGRTHHRHDYLRSNNENDVVRDAAMHRFASMKRKRWRANGSERESQSDSDLSLIYIQIRRLVRIKLSGVFELLDTHIRYLPSFEPKFPASDMMVHLVYAIYFVSLLSVRFQALKMFWLCGACGTQGYDEKKKHEEVQINRTNYQIICIF